LTLPGKIYKISSRVTPRASVRAGHRVLVGAMKIVKGDTVYLRSGKDAAAAASKTPGVRGRVLRVFPGEGKVLVEGVNMVTKHQKPRAAGGAAQVQQGGRIRREAAIPISRVMLVCPSCDKPTRVGMHLKDGVRKTAEGPKARIARVRVCKQCGTEIARQGDPLL
jgi:large subunit ribosomal protein L24